jgi:hypothetical protein
MSKRLKENRKKTVGDVAVYGMVVKKCENFQLLQSGKHYFNAVK